VRDTVGFSYPSSNFNYSDYRFTDDTNTSPAANLYVGTWYEQLEKTFLGLAVAKNSLDGGTDFAFGASTKGGTQDRTVIWPTRRIDCSAARSRRSAKRPTSQREEWLVRKKTC
jgi:hypothetical protein